MNNQEKRKKLIDNTTEHIQRVIINFANEMHNLMNDSHQMKSIRRVHRARVLDDKTPSSEDRFSTCSIQEDRGFNPYKKTIVKDAGKGWPTLKETEEYKKKMDGSGLYE